MREYNSEWYYHGYGEQHHHPDLGSGHEQPDRLYQYSDHQYHLFHHGCNGSHLQWFTHGSERCMGLQCGYDKRHTKCSRRVYLHGNLNRRMREYNSEWYYHGYGEQHHHPDLGSGHEQPDGLYQDRKERREGKSVDLGG